MARESKLDRFAEQLEQWLTKKKLGGDGLTFPQAANRLSELGCSVSPSTVWEWWEKFQNEKAEEKLFGLIASGGQMNKELDAEFKKNPAPQIEQLINVTKSLVMSLQVKGVADPSLLGIANSMQQTVLGYLTGITKAQHKEREVTLAETKAAEAKKTDQQKALEFCLEESKAFPEVQEQFKSAFAALKKARASK